MNTCPLELPPWSKIPPGSEKFVAAGNESRSPAAPASVIARMDMLNVCAEREQVLEEPRRKPGRHGAVDHPGEQLKRPAGEELPEVRPHVPERQGNQEQQRNERAPRGRVDSNLARVRLSKI